MRKSDATSAAKYPFLPRSPLRDGTALDNLRPDRSPPGWLFDRWELDPILPPLEGSGPFEMCARIQNKLHKLNGLVARSGPLDLPCVLAKDVAPYFRPQSDGTCGPKVPDHRGDPIDPLAILKKATPLVRAVLLHDPHGNEGADLDGMTYIVERLEEAKQLRVHQTDVRFDILEALSRLLSTILAKAQAEVLA
jgi:hypothetical protein